MQFWRYFSLLPFLAPASQSRMLDHLRMLVFYCLLFTTCGVPSDSINHSVLIKYEGTLEVAVRRRVCSLSGPASKVVLYIVVNILEAYWLFKNVKQIVPIGPGGCESPGQE